MLLAISKMKKNKKKLQTLRIIGSHLEHLISEEGVDYIIVVNACCKSCSSGITMTAIIINDWPWSVSEKSVKSSAKSAFFNDLP